MIEMCQVIIERAYQGNCDHIRSALDLFVDFAAIFVRSLTPLIPADGNPNGNFCLFAAV